MKSYNTNIKVKMRDPKVLKMNFNTSRKNIVTNQSSKNESIHLFSLHLQNEREFFTNKMSLFETIDDIPQLGTTIRLHATSRLYVKFSRIPAPMGKSRPRNSEIRVRVPSTASFTGRWRRQSVRSPSRLPRPQPLPPLLPLPRPVSQGEISTAGTRPRTPDGPTSSLPPGRSPRQR